MDKSLANSGSSTFSTGQVGQTVLGAPSSSQGTARATFINLTVKNTLTSEIIAYLKNVIVSGSLSYINSTIGTAKIYFRNSKLFIENRDIELKGNVTIQSLVVDQQSISTTAINTDQLEISDPLFLFGTVADKNPLNPKDRGILISYRDLVDKTKQHYALVHFHYARNGELESYFSLVDQPTVFGTEMTLEQLNNLDNYNPDVNNLCVLKIKKLYVSELNSILTSSININSPTLFIGDNNHTIYWNKSNITLDTDVLFKKPNGENFIKIMSNTGFNTGLSIVNSNNNLLNRIYVDNLSNVTISNYNNNIETKHIVINSQNNSLALGNQIFVNQQNNIVMNAKENIAINTNNLTIEPHTIDIGLIGVQRIVNYNGNIITTENNNNFLSGQQLLIFGSNIEPNSNGMYTIVNANSNTVVINASFNGLSHYGPINYISIKERINKPIIILSGNYSNENKLMYYLKIKIVGSNIFYSWKNSIFDVAITSIQYIAIDQFMGTFDDLTINITLDNNVIVTIQKPFNLQHNDTITFYASPLVVNGYCGIIQNNDNLTKHGIQFTTFLDKKINNYGINHYINDLETFWKFTDDLKFENNKMIFDNIPFYKDESDNLLFGDVVLNSSSNNQDIEHIYPFKINDNNDVIISNNLIVKNRIISETVKIENLNISSLTIDENLIDTKDDHKLYLNGELLENKSFDNLIPINPIKVTDENNIVIATDVKLIDLKARNISGNLLDINAVNFQYLYGNELNSNILNTKLININNNIFKSFDDNELYLNQDKILNYPNETLQIINPLKITDQNNIIISNNLSANKLNSQLVETNKILIDDHLLDSKDDLQLYLNDTLLIDQSTISLQQINPLKITDQNDVIISNNLSVNDSVVTINLQTNNLAINDNSFRTYDDHMLYLDNNKIINNHNQIQECIIPFKITDDNNIIISNNLSIEKDIIVDTIYSNGIDTNIINIDNNKIASKDDNLIYLDDKKILTENAINVDTIGIFKINDNNDVIINSDIKLKSTYSKNSYILADNIDQSTVQTITNTDCNKILNLDCIKYSYNDTDKINYGLEYTSVNNNLNNLTEVKNEKKYIDNNQIITLLVAKIQELEQRITTLEG